MTYEARRATAAALTLAVMTAGSTATSSLFVVYRSAWVLTSADIAIVFTAYVGTLLPVLVFFGGLAERLGRRTVIAGGILAMATGLLLLTSAHDLAGLVAARLFQGLGVGLSIGAVTATFAESYRGKLAQGNALQSVTAIGLFAGPVISAFAYDLGAGINASFVPGFVLVGAALALLRFFPQRTATVADAAGAARAEMPLDPVVVRSGLRFALPIVFVSWAGLSLYLSLVPAYLAATLHAVNPAIGAAAVTAAQVASLIATLLLGARRLERSGVIAPAVAVAGLALLVVGTSSGIWPLVLLATLLVGAGGGVASAAAFGIAGRIGRGQRSRIFARMFVAAYLGYSVPVLAIGVIGVHAPLTVAFAAVVAALALVTSSLPLLRERVAAPVCGRVAAVSA